ncbi:MAG TPA: tetratricopeptide repeat protein [Bacteroidales bacterium]|nr:tetratricopeptide repeat protein [Bacteroidales bacterium]
MKKDFVLTLALLLLLGTTSCQVKARSTTLSTDASVVETEISFEESNLEPARVKQTQPRSFGTGQDSVICVKNLSLFSESIRHRNFSMSLDPWRWLFFNCPLASPNIYIMGASMFRSFIDRETVAQRREALIDTLMMIHNQRIKYFGHEGLVLERKTLDLFAYRPLATRDHFEISERAIKLQDKASLHEVIRINFLSGKTLVEAGVLQPERLVEMYDRASSIIEFNLANNHRDSVAFRNTKDQIQTMFDPFASCENLVRIYQPRFDATPRDPQLLERITTMLDRSGCTNENLFYLATKNLHQIKPNAQSAFLMGRLYSNQENYQMALQYFEHAVALSQNGNGVDLFTTHMIIADILFRNLNRLPQARNSALAAAELRHNDGRPHILIGQMYAMSAKTCGTDEISIAAVYWAAVDRFIRARNIDSDPQVVETANKLISSISQHFPNNETLFFHGLDGGKTVRAGCWINEVTVARPRP